MFDHSTIQRTNDDSWCMTLTTYTDDQYTLKENNLGDLQPWL